MRFSRSVFSAAVLGVLLGPARGIAIDTDVTDADIHRAVTIAMSSKDIRARFHQPYILPIKDQTVERIEVVTEFRRFVLASEEQATLGNWMVARGGYDAKGRTLKQLVAERQGLVAIKVTVRFHPQHRYSTVPIIDILPGEPTVEALDVVRTPLMALSTDGQPTVMTGAIVETLFNAQVFGERTLPIRIVFEGKEILRVPADFARLD